LTAVGQVILTLKQEQTPTPTVSISQPSERSQYHVCCSLLLVTFCVEMF